MLPGMGLCQENFICLESDSEGGEKKSLEVSEEGWICPRYGVFAQPAHVQLPEK